MSELCYRLRTLPDLTLNKYSSLDEVGVSGVLEKHLAFLRQWNRKGALSDLSLHLFYYYTAGSASGDQLEILLLIRGEEAKLRSVPELIKASPLSGFFRLDNEYVDKPDGKPQAYSFDRFFQERQQTPHAFDACSTLIKKELFIESLLSDARGMEHYYVIPEWETNEGGRLYDIARLMGALDKTIVYRADLYPTDKSIDLREALRNPMTKLRERVDYNMDKEQDHEARNVLRQYEKMLENIESSPHFLMNLFVFGPTVDETMIVLNAAGSEALKKGNYTIASFNSQNGPFTARSFLDDGVQNASSFFDGACGTVLNVQGGRPYICDSRAQDYILNYLPTLFTLEEVAPFFRLPTLYDGEVVAKRKETTPSYDCDGKCILLGKDTNGYDIYFPLKNLEKHAFIAGVPGSGKTNAMHHLSSTLWKKHKIRFLALEPAKKEYRALVNQEKMEDMYFFSPGAHSLFPLHINPFEFPKGLRVTQHINNLKSVFEGTFPLEPPMPFLLDRSLEGVYTELGWSMYAIYNDNTTLRFPTMSMLYDRLEKEINATDYGSENRGNLKSALQVRIGSLLQREVGDIFDVPTSTIPPEQWLDIPAVIELEALGSAQSNFLTLLLCTLIRESLQVSPDFNREYARHVIIIEEAHNLIGPEAEEVFGVEANPKQAATAYIVKMLAEVRALHEGIIIADQLPTAMAEQVLKNTGLKLALRITAPDDRSLLGSTMAASNIQLEQMATFATGDALVSYESLLRPFQIRIQDWCAGLSEEEARKQREPLPDKALQEHLSKFAPYTMIREQSLFIESERLINRCNKLATRSEEHIAHINYMSGLRKRQAGYAQGAIPSGDASYDQRDIAQQLSNARIDTRYMMALSTRDEWIIFAKSTLERMEYYITLGFPLKDEPREAPESGKLLDATGIGVRAFSYVLHQCACQAQLITTALIECEDIKGQKAIAEATIVEKLKRLIRQNVPGFTPIKTSTLLSIRS